MILLSIGGVIGVLAFAVGGFGLGYLVAKKKFEVKQGPDKPVKPKK